MTTGEQRMGHGHDRPAARAGEAASRANGAPLAESAGAPGERAKATGRPGCCQQKSRTFGADRLFAHGPRGVHGVLAGRQRPISPMT